MTNWWWRIDVLASARRRRRCSKRGVNAMMDLSDGSTGSAPLCDSSKVGFFLGTSRSPRRDARRGSHTVARTTTAHGPRTILMSRLSSSIEELRAPISMVGGPRPRSAHAKWRASSSVAPAADRDVPKEKSHLGRITDRCRSSRARSLKSIMRFTPRFEQHAFCEPRPRTSMRHHQFSSSARPRAAAKSRRPSDRGPVTKMVSPGCAPASQDGRDPDTRRHTVTGDCDVVGLSEVAAHYGTTRSSPRRRRHLVKFFQVRSRRRAHRDDRTPRAPTPIAAKSGNRGGDRLETEVSRGTQRPSRCTPTPLRVGADECFAHERSQNGPRRRRYDFLP